MKTYTPNQIKKLRKKLGLSTDEFGEALGLSDPGRIIRGWESGERNGRPTGPSGSALAAIHYLLAIQDFLVAARETVTFGEFNTTLAVLDASLPEPLRVYAPEDAG